MNAMAVGPTPHRPSPASGPRRARPFKTFRPLLLASLLLAAVTSSPAPLPLAAAPTPDTRFGVAEGFRNAAAMSTMGAGWERVVLSWPEIQPSAAGDFSHLGQSLPNDRLQPELDRGVKVAGLLQFTPDWAAAQPDLGQRSPPKNLDLPFDDPNNYFGQYVYRTVKYYAGRIDQWIIWNEPEFKPGDPGAGGSFTWLGSDAQFAQLLKVGYLAAKKANPNAVVSFPGTSYWVDQNSGRPQFYDRLLGILGQDPDAAAHNFYHDATSLNLYRASDDIVRVHAAFVDIQHKYRIDKPIWLTETNAMPTDDAAIACRHGDDPVNTTMEQQAAYVEQAVALAAAAGYGQIEVYQMVDGDACKEPAVWGMTRDDGTPRPAAEALRTALTAFSGYARAQFVPLVRDAEAWSPWPGDQGSYLPNWQVYQVAFDKPGKQRVTALWNGDGAMVRARIRKTGASAKQVDRRGASQPLQENQGWWVVDLPAATAHFRLNDQIRDPDTYHYIGGDPVLIVEEGTDPAAAVAPPSLGDPGSDALGLSLAVNPVDGQTVAAGQPADFQLRTRGTGGFAGPVSLAISQWSTQRDPTPRDAGSLPLHTSMAQSVQAGDTATLHVDTAGTGPGIYYMTVAASGGSFTQSVDLALVID